MHRHYLLTGATLATLLTLAIILFCLVIDPYAMYPSLTGSKQGEKTDLFYHLRLHKPYAMEKAQAEHLIIGSSRSARLPPSILGERAYNASLPGIRLREIRRMVEHAHAIQPLKSLYIGVDYYMFRPDQTELTSHYVDQRLRTIQPSLRNNLARWFQYLEDGWSSLFSVDAMLTSAELIMGVGSSQRIYYEDGTWATDAPSKPPRWLYSLINRQKMRDFSNEKDEPSMVEFDDLMDFCRENDIPTTVLISPFHASVMNTVNMAGRWENYLSWQYRVTDSVNKVQGDFRVVGLEGNSGVVMEPIVTESPFFLDGVHYNSAAGKKVMICLSGGQCAGEIEIFPLDTETIAPYLEYVDELMRRYPEERPDDYRSLLKWLHRNAAATAKAS